MDFNLSPGMFSSEAQFKPLDRERTYDVLIVGGGPAGLTAAVYCMRKGVSTGLIVKEVGGQVALTADVENYMGYRYISGLDLVAKFREQALQFGVDYDEGGSVASIGTGGVKTVVMEDGRVFSARALILATGKSWRRLGVPGEEELRGRGVAYCSTCDGPLFRDRRVVVAGGGNSAVEAAIDLARIAAEVTVVQFLDRLTADAVLVEKLGTFANHRVRYASEVVSINGTGSVESVTVRDRTSGAEETIGADGIFIEIGLVPNSGFARGALRLNEAGEIAVDSACRTSAPGVFAAGDVTDVPFKQIIVAGGEGAKAALSACNYVNQAEGPRAS